MSFSFLKRLVKPRDAAPDPADREKSAGAREYNARWLERDADRMEKAGDSEGARLERAAAEEARRPPPRIRPKR